MTTEDLPQILAMVREAETKERRRCLKAVDDEPELPGTMGDQLWDTINGNREMTEKCLRIAVQKTKEGIRNRILEAP